jgi:Ycf4
MVAPTTSQDNLLLRQEILGSRRLSNYWWATVVLVAGTGFLLAAISSYLKVNLFPLSNTTQLIFIPQGLAMGFYGVAGVLLGIYLWLVILWDVGGGFNEFNKKTGLIKIFRWGYPGKNRQIEISRPLNDAQGIRVELKEGLNPRRMLYLRMKGMREIPLIRVGQPISLSELENKGAELARFLGVPLEGL